ncbi:MAG: PQ-loop domain-containing transporter [Candidatus Thermoplasmatota archaeon]|jgi:MtN3 and saliva related transmembrane protein|nr:PQ-loop domain-containing transporter [Candidatus Thermoplasmatota archaeon]|tara:strand:+ start:17633 stop:17908 length:276 start_codon:yes stop_codon:yes gene_type:complete
MEAFLIESIGIIAGTLGVIAWLPQLREVWIEGLHEGISLPTFWLVSTALVLWLIYGILIRSVSIIVANVAALACILSLIIGVIRLRKEKSD